MLSRPIVNATTLLKHNSVLHESYIEQYALDNDFQDVYAILSQGNQVEEFSVPSWKALYSTGRKRTL